MKENERKVKRLPLKRSTLKIIFILFSLGCSIGLLFNYLLQSHTLITYKEGEDISGSARYHLQQQHGELDHQHALLKSASVETNSREVFHDEDVSAASSDVLSAQGSEDISRTRINPRREEGFQGNGGGRYMDSDVWVPLSCGFTACFIGLLYPLMDQILVVKTKNDWTKVLRCCGAFIGLNYAIPRLSGSTDISLIVFLCLGLWFTFDKTIHGGIIAFLMALIGTNVVAALVDQGFYSFARSDLFGIAIWFPMCLYSAATTFGLLGRQLTQTFT